MRGKGDWTRRRRAPDIRAKAWQAMRILREFALPDIVSATGITSSNCRKYLTRLERAGFLRRIQCNVSGRAGSFIAYRLVRNSGPHAPVLRVDGAVTDTNTGRAYGPDGEEISDGMA